MYTALNCVISQSKWYFELIIFETGSVLCGKYKTTQYILGCVHVFRASLSLVFGSVLICPTISVMVTVQTPGHYDYLSASVVTLKIWVSIFRVFHQVFILITWFGLPLIPTWISNRMPNTVRDEITYPFRNGNGCTVEDWEWICNLILHFVMNVSSSCWE